MRLADQVLQSLNSHAWEGDPTGPTGPHEIPAPSFEAGHALRGPISWRHPGLAAVGADGPLSHRRAGHSESVPKEMARKWLITDA